MIKGFLIDLDGVIYNDSQPIAGAAETIQWLEHQNIPYRFITNTTMKSRATISSKMKRMGIPVPAGHIFSAVRAAARFLESKQPASCHLMLTEDACSEFHGIRIAEDRADYVVAGDLGDRITFEHLNRAFQYLHAGAELIALQKNRFWLSDRGYTIDAGAFVALLEFAARKQALVTGKPSADFFQMVLEDMGLPASEVAMIGDDIESDITGANNAGIHSVLVKTGKFCESDLQQSTVKPDYMLESIAELPDAGIFG